MRTLFLGVDGGGTKTEFVCIDGDGRQLASTTVGTTYHNEVGLEEAARRLGDALAKVCASVGCAPDAITHAFFGLPAYGEDRTVDPLLHAACGVLLGHARYTCGNDMVCGWAGSLACADGINIVAGTGSIGYGERRGRSARAGGWGEVFGDEGSAHAIAIEGLRAFSRMSDGREPKGVLYDLIVEALSLSDDLALCERIIGAHGMTRAEIAALAPLVSSAAAEGDLSALSIFHNAAYQLYELARALRRRLGFDAAEHVAISWSGSILTRVDPICTRFVTLLEEEGGYVPVTPRHSPSYGAALYARIQASR